MKHRPPLIHQTISTLMGGGEDLVPTGLCHRWGEYLRVKYRWELELWAFMTTIVLVMKCPLRVRNGNTPRERIESV